MYVKNVDGSSRLAAPSGFDSWLDYWKKQTEESPKYCAVQGCLNKDLVGAHVQKAFSLYDKRLYIVPLCTDCNRNSSSEVFYVDEALVPVPGYHN